MGWNVVCIHSGVLLNNRPLRDGASRINSRALTRNLSLFFSENLLIIYTSRVQSVSRISRKHVVKHNFHCFPLRIIFRTFFLLFSGPPLQSLSSFSELLVSFLKSSVEVSACHILTTSFLMAFQWLWDLRPTLSSNVLKEDLHLRINNASWHIPRNGILTI